MALGSPSFCMRTAGSAGPPSRIVICTTFSVAQTTPPTRESSSNAPMEIPRSRKKPATGRADRGCGPSCNSMSGVPLTSYVEVGNLQSIGIDEFAARFHHIAHQRAEDLVGGNRVLDADLQQAARIRVHRGVPQLFRIHFAQALEALDA